MPVRDVQKQALPVGLFDLPVGLLDLPVGLLDLPVVCPVLLPLISPVRLQRRVFDFGVDEFGGLEPVGEIALDSLDLLVFDVDFGLRGGCPAPGVARRHIACRHIDLFVEEVRVYHD